MRRLALLLLLSVLALLVIPASAQDLPNFSDLPLGEWTQVEVSEGICLYGGDYSFFVHSSEAETEKLLIYFQGGGACWDGATCGDIGEFASFYEVTSETINFYAEGYGIFDFDNPANPLADYTVVFLPYCTGDVHSGDNALTFDVPEEVGADFAEIDVHFNGFNNTQIVLDWVYEHITTPEQIVVSGCSAGGYGAVTYAPYIMNHYAGVPTALIADSSHGVLAPDWQGLDTWGILDNLPEFVGGMEDVTREDYDTSLYLKLSAEQFPDNQFAEFNSYLDGVQIGFYGNLLGYDLSFENDIVVIAAQWSAALSANLRQLNALENFDSYTAGGSQHCVVNYDEFYEYDQSGVIFSEWFADVIADSAENVTCSILAQDCFVSPLGDN